MNQHQFVKQCLERYGRLDIIPGDPNEGKWQNAHYPAPNPEGDTTIPMLFDDHQQQGIYQSEEYGRCCFWIGDTKQFLTHGPFVPNWFELWDLYDKWSGEHSIKNLKKVHEEKDEEGKSVTAVKAGKKTHEEKNEEGKSIYALETNKKLHEEKNKEGKSILAVNAANKSHEEKDELGRSVTAMKLSMQRWQNTHPDWPPFIAPPGPLSNWQKARGIPTEFRIRLPNDFEVVTVTS